MSDHRIKEDIKQAAGLISFGFAWDQTPQGQEYWNEVYKALIELSKDNCPHCGHEVKKEV